MASRIESDPDGAGDQATPRDDTAQALGLALELELSSISGYQDDLPTITTQGIEFKTSLITGGIYLLGPLEASYLYRTLGGSPLPSLYGRNRAAFTLQV